MADWAFKTSSLSCRCFRFLSIDMKDSSDTLLAHVSIRNRSVTRNPALDKILFAARGWLKPTGTSQVTIALPYTKTSRLDLQHDVVWCKYGSRSSTTAKPPVEKAVTSLLPAKILHWKIKKAPGAANSFPVIEVPTASQEIYVFSPATAGGTQTLGSLEFYNPQGVAKDFVLYLWKDFPNVTLLTVFAARKSPLAASAADYKCKVKVCDSYRACRSLDPPASLASGEKEDWSWQWGVIAVVIVAVAAVVVIFVVRRRCVNRRRSNPTDAENEPDGTEPFVSKGNDQSALSVSNDNNQSALPATKDSNQSAGNLEESSQDVSLGNQEGEIYIVRGQLNDQPTDTNSFAVPTPESGEDALLPSGQ